MNSYYRTGSTIQLFIGFLLLVGFLLYIEYTVANVVGNSSTAVETPGIRRSRLPVRTRLKVDLQNPGT